MTAAEAYAATARVRDWAVAELEANTDPEREVSLSNVAALLGSALEDLEHLR